VLEINSFYQRHSLRMTPRDVETSKGLIFVINCILLGTCIADILLVIVRTGTVWIP
jgi:hypothetical protein